MGYFNTVRYEVMLPIVMIRHVGLIAKSAKGLSVGACL